MKLALYHPWVYLKGGIERTLVELLSRSQHDWTVFTNHYAPEDTFPELKQFSIVELPKVSVRRNIFAVAKAASTLLFQRLDLKGYDGLLISSEGLGDLMALRANKIPIACLCFTPLKAIHDRYARQRLLSGGLKLRLRLGLTAFNLVDRLAWLRYERIFCISEEVRARVLSARLAPSKKIEILYPGVDVQRLEPSWEMEPYFLLPGRMQWTKNIQLAIQSFHRFKEMREPGDPFRLVIAGMVDAKSRSYYEYLRHEAGDEKTIQFVVSPTDEELFSLYQRCQAVVFPPFNEDWGLVPLEAMAFGKPVISLNRGGPRESMSNGETGFLCADDPDEFAQAMVKLTDLSLAQAMGRAGRLRVPRFSWGSFVGRIDGYFEERCGVDVASMQRLTVND